jgi:small subunit ribosomal protein S18
MYSNSKTVLNGMFEDLDNTLESIDSLDYKDTKTLSNFISDQGKIMPRRVTGLTSKQQKRVAKLIKRARIASLLPFVIGKN